MVVERRVSIGGKPARQARQPKSRLPVESQATCLSRFFVCLAGHRSSLTCLTFRAFAAYPRLTLAVFHGPYTPPPATPRPGKFLACEIGRFVGRPPSGDCAHLQPSRLLEYNNGVAIRWARSADRHGIDREDAKYAIANRVYWLRDFDEPRIEGDKRPDLFIGPPVMGSSCSKSWPKSHHLGTSSSSTS